MEVLLEDQEIGSLDAGSDNDEEGMEISCLKVDYPALNIVTVANVNNDISAQTFQALTRDTFSGSNTRPLSII
jgi:hypothetical protein